MGRLASCQMPERSGLPSGVLGTGAERFGFPSLVRGIPGVGKSIHCAEALATRKRLVTMKRIYATLGQCRAIGERGQTARTSGSPRLRPAGGRRRHYRHQALGRLHLGGALHDPSTGLCAGFQPGRQADGDGSRRQNRHGLRYSYRAERAEVDRVVRQDSIGCVQSRWTINRLQCLGRIKLWDTSTWNEVQTLPHQPPPSSIRSDVNSVAFSPDGRWSASGGMDKSRVRLWRSQE